HGGEAAWLLVRVVGPEVLVVAGVVDQDRQHVVGALAHDAGRYGERGGGRVRTALAAAQERAVEPGRVRPGHTSQRGHGDRAFGPGTGEVPAVPHVAVVEPVVVDGEPVQRTYPAGVVEAGRGL